MHYELVIIGSGSAASIPSDLTGTRIALVEGATPYGGTCLNHGCIPTKMLVFPADLAASVEHARRLGVDLGLDGVRWGEIRDRIFAQRIDKIAQAGYEWRRGPDGGATVYDGWARFVAPGELDVELHSGSVERITADKVLLGAGSRPVIPDIEGLADVMAAAPERVHTNQTVMRVPALPRRMLIVGGGFVGCEFAHVFSSFGVEVTQVVRSGRLLRAEDEDVSARMTELAGRQWGLMLESRVTRMALADGAVRAWVATPDGDMPLDVDAVLLAAGRIPNSDRLGLDAAGVDVHPDGRIVVDEYQRTTAAGVFAIGDVSSDHMLKHVANHEARVAFHNLAHPERTLRADHRYVPHAVFTHPQIAAVGLTEREAREQYGDAAITVKVQGYGDVAYGWAMEDTTGFVKLIADRRRDRLVGAHLIGPQASTLVQPLVQAMSFEQPASSLARGQYWIHPALPEVVENALLGLDL
jgi:mycothione reductase